MAHLNQVILLGCLGKDPEVIATKIKGPLTRLSLATTRHYTDNQGHPQQDTQWHTVYLSNGLAKAAEATLKKGDRIYVIGELRTRSWVDENSKPCYATAVYAKEFQLLNHRPSADTEIEAAATQDCPELSEAKSLT